MKTSVYLSKFSLFGLSMLILTAFLAYLAGRGEISWLGVALALPPGALMGAFLARRLRQVETALEALRRGRLQRLAQPWGDPLSELAGQVNQLALLSAGADQDAGLAGLRQGLVRQIEETAAQQERNRLARELHDSIKQQLFSIQMNAAAAQARLPGDVPGAGQALADVRQDTAAALVEMDVLLQQLSPAPLEKVGLAQALREQCEALGYRSGAQVTCEIGELPPDDGLPPGAQEALFRIAQEALSNIARHARCQHAWLRLALDDRGQNLLLEVRDDGQGFDPDRASEGRGLSSIRQRVDDLAGDFWLESAPGKGALLRVSLPCIQPAGVEEPARGSKTAINRVTLLGLAGGLLLAAWLYAAAALPLHSPAPAILQLVGLALLIGVGWLAARLAPQGAALAGAAAGGVAGITAFGLAGAAFSVQRGAQALLDHGLLPAAGEDQALILIIRSLTGIFGWSQASFWGLLLAGVSLGTFGALAVRRLASPGQAVDWRREAALLATVTALGGGLAFLANSMTFINLEAAVYRAVSENNLAGVNPLDYSRVMVWSLLTPALFYLAALIWRLRMAAAERKTRSSFEMDLLAWETFWLALGSLALGFFTPFLLGWQGLDSSMGVMTLTADIIALASLALGIFFLIELRRVRKQMLALGLPVLPVLHYVAAALIPLIPVTFILTIFAFGTGWPALLLALVELGLLLYLRSQQARNLPRKVKVSLAGKTLASSLGSAWLAAAVALVSPGLSIIAASLGAVLFPVEMIVYLFGTRMADPAVLTIRQMVLHNQLYQALAFVISLALACILMGIALAVANLASAARRRGV